jgi:glucuronate isomerase
LKTFITENFLLHSKEAVSLYYDYANQMPIIDYHNHLLPEDIANNRQFNNATQVWLNGDHYKWRAMRTLGIKEKYITGNASDEEKFLKWAETVRYTVRNPLFHWTHLELLRYFGIKELLTEENAKGIYNNINNQLQQESHSTRGLLHQQNVELVCTTEDPLDNLQYHKAFKNEQSTLKMSTAFRPDNAYAVEDSKVFVKYVEDLELITNRISNYGDYIGALESRITYFHNNGCRLSDHGLSYLPYFETGTFDIDSLFNKLRDGKQLSQLEVDYFKSETLKHLCQIYHKKGWVQQFHLGALRNVNSRLIRQAGVNSGFDSIGDFSQVVTLGKFLNYLDQSNQLSKTILYNLNPADNEIFATMIGNFNDGSIRGKIQFGAAWWFLDQKDGIEKQLNALSSMGLISCFVGMLTDSRSFLSFPRHEYFRRILCNLIGNEIKKGELPNDIPFFGKIIQDICYNNAKNYFDFN